VTGSTGIDASAVSLAADENGVGVTCASVNHVADITARMLTNRFTVAPSGAAKS
jgi:hypothetical protein